jgi:hypothetical protein
MTERGHRTSWSATASTTARPRRRRRRRRHGPLRQRHRHQLGRRRAHERRSSRIPFLIQLGRKTRGIITQNIIAAIIIAVAGLALAATGRLEVLMAFVWHIAGDVFVIANSFRLIRFGDDFAEAHGESVFDADRRGRREGSVILTGGQTAAPAS